MESKRCLAKGEQAVRAGCSASHTRSAGKQRRRRQQQQSSSTSSGSSSSSPPRLDNRAHHHLGALAGGQVGDELGVGLQ